jgi:hypothetical protein
MPEYKFLLELVRSESLDQIVLEPGQAFSVKLLQAKGLVESSAGYAVPTALGRAAARARKADVSNTAVFIAAADLAAAAASDDQTPGES